MDRHRQGLLAEPPAYGVDVGAGFNQQRADGVAQPVERQAVADEPVLLQPRDRFNEGRIETARRPRRAVGRRRDCDRVVGRCSCQQLCPTRVNWDRYFLASLVKLIAFLLVGILVTLGVIADRIH